MGICVPSTHPKACGNPYLFSMPLTSSFNLWIVLGNFIHLGPKTLVIMSHTFRTTNETVQFATPNAFAVTIREP